MFLSIYLDSVSFVTFVCLFCVHRVRTDPGKVWKVLEFNVEIFKALKSLIGMEKSGKILENCNVDLKNTDVRYTVDYRCIC